MHGGNEVPARLSHSEQGLGAVPFSISRPHHPTSGSWDDVPGSRLTLRAVSQVPPLGHHKRKTSQNDAQLIRDLERLQSYIHFSLINRDDKHTKWET